MTTVPGAMSMPALRERTLAATALVIPLALSAWVFFPILRNYFRGDDFLSFYLIRNLPLFDYLVEPRAGHLRFTSNLVFLAASSAYGTNPPPYFWTALIFHLLNVLLLFRLLAVLTENRLTACFGATLWGVSPVHGDALGWFDVFGHVLVGTFLLSILLGFTRVATGTSAPKRLWMRRAVWALLIVAASGSFGVGIGIAMTMPVVALLLLPAGSERRRSVAILVLAAAVVAVIYAVLQPSPGRHPFPDRVMRSLQTATTRAQPLFTMTCRMAEYGAGTLLAGFWLDPSRPSRTVTAAAALATLSLLVLGAIGATPRQRRILFAGLLIAAAAYGVIAAGRVEFVIKGNTALLVAPRYQYVAQIGLTIAICIALGGLTHVVSLPPRTAPRLFAVWIAFTLWGAAVHGPYIVNNATGRREAANVLAEIRRSIDATPEGGDVYIRNRALTSFGLIGRAEQLLPGWAAVFVIFYPDNVVDGRRVYFVTTHPGALRAAKRGRRSATLLVAGTERERLSSQLFPRGGSRRRAPLAMAT
jgi:hypothetical protein